MIHSDLYCKNCFKRIFKEKGTYTSFDDRGDRKPIGGDHAPHVRSHETTPLTRRMSLIKCAVSDCNIPRAAGKSYCVRHFNVVRAELEANSTQQPQAPLARREQSTRALHRIAQETDQQPQLHGNHVSHAPETRAPAVQRSSSRANFASAVSTAVRAAAEEVQGTQLSHSASVEAALSRQGSLRALYGVEPSTRSPGVSRQASTHALPTVAEATPGGPSVHELSAQVKALQWDNANLRADVDNLRRTVQEMGSSVQRLAERIA